MENHTVGLAKSLEALGYEICIVELGSSYYGQGCFDQSENINVECFATSRPLKNPGLIESFKFLMPLRGHVLIFPKGWFEAGSWLFDLAARLLFSRYITIEHSASLPMPPKLSRKYIGGIISGVGLWWYKAMLRNFLRTFYPHHVFCVSDAVRKMFIHHHYFPSKKVTTIHNGIDADKFQPSFDYKDKFRREMGIPQDALVFGSIGRLECVKGYDVAIELFKKLISNKILREIWFVLVGNGSQFETLMQMAADLGVKDKIRLISFTDKPWEIYPALDVFLMPSLNEGLPLSLLESMACGCCPIAMGVGGIPEVITSPELGWLVPPNDKHRFYEAMKEAAEIDSGRLKVMGKKGREHVILNFNAENQFSTLANLIDKECTVN